jgi:hypothetical protein
MYAEKGEGYSLRRANGAKNKANSQHALTTRIKLWQPAQPEQTKQTNQKTPYSPKNKAPEEVVLRKRTHNNK